MGFVIPTRQKADALFASSSPLGAGSSFTSAIARVAGYNQVSILAVSDQAFTITVEEAAQLPPTLAQPEEALVPIPLPPPTPPPSPPAPVNPPALGVGSFVQTQATINSSLVNGQQVVAMRIQPFGVYMTMTVKAGGVNQTLLDFAALGIPLP